MNHRVAATLLVLFLFVAGLSAQQGLTSLNGTVSDPTGAVIPGATVVLDSVERGVQRETTSDEAGRYNFPQVQPGQYRVRAKSSGFADVLVGDVRLLVNTPATVNITFTEVGTVAETVSVSAQATQVNTSDASIGNAFGTKPIVELPLEGRNVAQLLSLQPGVTFIGSSADLDIDSRNGSVAGGRSDQANVTLDGIDVNEQQNRYAFTSVLRSTLDSVQEFRVTTVNPTADLGRSSGAQISMVTKSGTNAYHGSLYEYHRNTVTSANSFFNNAVPSSEDNPTGGVPRPKLIRNVFGASAAGPIIKNRQFFFLNYEGRRDAREADVVQAVPSETLRQGIVRYENAAGGVSTLTAADIRAIDPLGLGVNQAALDVLRSYPMPNSDEQGEGLNTRAFRFTSPIRLKWDTYIAKFDTYLDNSGRHSLFVRGNLQNDRANAAQQFPNQPAASYLLTNSKGIALGYTGVFTPSLVGNTRYGYTRQGAEQTSALGISFIQVHRDLSAPFDSTRGLARIIPVHQLAQDMSWTKGSHQVKFGAVMRDIQNKRVDYQNSFFGGSTNSAWMRDTGAELRDPVLDLSEGFYNAYSEAMAAVMGLVTEVNANYNYDLDGNPLAVGAPQLRNFAMREYEMYVQDTWKLRPNLTITAGLRWSLFPPVEEKQGYQTTILPQLQGVETVSEWFGLRGALAAAGRPQTEAGDLTFVRRDDPNGRPLYPYHKKNFSPRLAVAYSPRGDSGWRKWLFGSEGNTTIRAGAGLLYDVFGQSIIRNFNTAQLGFSAALTNPSGSLSLAEVPRFTGLTSIPGSITPSAPPAGFPVVAPNDYLTIGTGVDDTIVPPYSITLNFSLGREFSKGFFVEGSYVGRLSRRLLSGVDVAMPTNLKDPKSGQTYIQAIQTLARQQKQGVATANVAPVPFFENMFPDAATTSQTATQSFYRQVVRNGPDYLTNLFNADAFCYPACSIYGPYSMFQNQYSAMSVFRNVGSASYHSMQWTLRKRFSGGNQFDLNYTWSKSIDWGSGTERDGEFALTNFIVNAWEPRQAISVSDWDIRHQFNMNGVFELPVGRGRHFASGIGKGLDYLIGGWQLAGIWRWTSGLPYYVYNGRVWPTNWNLAGYATPTGPLQTTMGSFKDAPAVQGDPGPNIFANPQAALDSYDFTLPGETGVRNTLRGDGFFTIDGSLSKRFVMPFSENHSAQIRWEVFNVTNSVRFDPASISNFLTISGSFGKYSALLTQPRVMQFGLRYEF